MKRFGLRITVPALAPVVLALAHRLQHDPFIVMHRGPGVSAGSRAAMAHSPLTRKQQTASKRPTRPRLCAHPVSPMGAVSRVACGATTGGFSTPGHHPCGCRRLSARRSHGAAAHAAFLALQDRECVPLRRRRYLHQLLLAKHDVHGAGARSCPRRGGGAASQLGKAAAVATLCRAAQPPTPRPGPIGPERLVAHQCYRLDPPIAAFAAWLLGLLKGAGFDQV